MPALIEDQRWTQDALPQLTVNGPFTVNGVTTQTGGVGGLVAASVAATAGLNTAETVLAKFALVPAQTLRVGSKVRITCEGTCTSTNADVSTFTVRAGILGTTADASVATVALTSSGSGTAQAFKVVLEFNVRTLGASGTAAGSGVAINQGTTGIIATAQAVIPFTSATLATTTATFLDITYVSAAVTTTCTFQDASIEVLS